MAFSMAQRSALRWLLMWCALAIACALPRVAAGPSSSNSHTHVPPVHPSYVSKPTEVAASDPGSALVFNWQQGASVHDPVTLNGQNFFDLVLDSRQGWIVAFVAPWCGHCRALHAPFREASRSLVSTVRLGTVDATAEQSLASQFKISAYPTLLVFPPGKKTPATIRKYEGGREAVAIAAHARTMLNLRAMRKVESAHPQFPANLVGFFGGGARSNFAGAALPSLLVFLHAHAPGDELKAVSQSFEHRLSMGVVGRDDKTLQRLFRVRSTPTFLACAPARYTRTNVTGVVECAVYDHAGAGSSVPSISNFLVDFIRAVTDGADLTAARAKYGLRRFVVDGQLAAKHAEDAGADPAAASAAARALPPPVSSADDFHARCTDTTLGACVLVFAEPDAWRSAEPTSTTSSTTAGAAAAAAVAGASASLVALLSDVDSWNAQHATRKSQLLSLLLVSSSSPAAAALSDTYGVSLDTSPGGLTLLALLPRRNRYLTLPPSGSFDVAAAVEWLETVVRDDRKLRPSKQANMQQRLRDMMTAAGGDEAFQSTFAQAAHVAQEPTAATPSVHEDL